MIGLKIKYLHFDYGNEYYVDATIIAVVVDARDETKREYVVEHDKTGRIDRIKPDIITEYLCEKN